jgi:hypothetical protein
MIDATVNTIHTEVEVLEEDGQARAAQIVMVGGMILPIASGPGQPPLQVPALALRFPMGKAALGQLIERAQEAYDALPEERTSDLMIANSLQGVDKLADADRQFRG